MMNRRSRFACLLAFALALPLFAYADTPETISQIQNDLRDGQPAGSITPQIIRNFAVSTFVPYPTVINAAGTTQGTAPVLTAQFNIITTCASGAGVMATSYYTKIWNSAANACLVYPITGAQFNSNGTNVPISVPAGGAAEFVMQTTTQGYWHTASIAFDVADFGAPTNGTSDATTAIQTALNAAGAAGGGRVLLGPYRYKVSGLTIPSRVALVGNYAPGGQLASQCYTSDPALLLASTGTITQQAGSMLQNLEIQRQGLSCPTDLRSMINQVQAYAGTAITIAGNDTWDKDLFILGFAQAWYSTGQARHHLDGMIGDNTAGIYLDNSHDTSRISNVHYWNYLTGSQSWTVTTYSVSALANNGSGLIRVTTTAPHALVTGDTINLAGVGGLTAANARWVVTVIDTTHFDLQGSSFTGPTFTGTTTSGSAKVTSVSSLAGVTIGQAVSGTGIPGGTTVASVNDGVNNITLSANATASGTVSITQTNGAYTTGGTVYIPAGWLRTGEAFHVSNSEFMIFTNLGAFGYNIGFHAGTGACWTFVSGLGVDVYGPAADNQAVGILVDGASCANSFEGGFVSSYGESIRVNSSYTPVSAQKFNNLSISESSGYYTVGTTQGSAIYVGNAFRSGTLYVADGTTTYLAGNEQYALQAVGESPAALATVANVGSSLTGVASPGAFTGSYPNRGLNLGLDAGGTGAITATTHDGSTSGGSAAGQGAVDFQMLRNANTQVASGQYAFAAGTNNVASGLAEVVFGQNQNVSGVASAAVNFGHTVTGHYSFASGVRVNDGGLYANRCHSSGSNFVGGDAEACEQQLRGTGSTATAFRMTADGTSAGSANCFNIPNASAESLEIRLHARDHTTNGTDYDWYLPTAIYTRDATAASTAVSLGTPVTITRGTTTGAAVSVTADTTNGCLNVSFTPPSGNTDTWTAVARVVGTRVQ